MNARTEEWLFITLVFVLPTMLAVLAIGGIYWVTQTYNLSEGTMIMLTGLVVFGFPKLMWGE